MKRFFDLKTRTVEGKLCNRKEFSLKVSGISILISWPLPFSRIYLSERAMPGTPRVKINLVSAAMQSFTEVSQIIKNVNIKISLESKHELNLLAELATRAKVHFTTILYSIKKEADMAALRLKIFLFNSGQGHQTVSISHEASMQIGHFYKLSEWDYVDPQGDLQDETNMRLLQDLDYIDPAGNTEDTSNQYKLSEIDNRTL